MKRRSINSLQILSLVLAATACGSTKRFDRSTPSTVAASDASPKGEGPELQAEQPSHSFQPASSQDGQSSSQSSVAEAPQGPSKATPPAAIAVPPVAVGGAFLVCNRLAILEPLAPLLDPLAPVLDQLNCQIDDEKGNTLTLPRTTVVTFTFVALESEILSLPLAATRNDTPDGTKFLIVSQDLGVGQIVASVNDGTNTQELSYDTRKLEEDD